MKKYYKISFISIIDKKEKHFYLILKGKTDRPIKNWLKFWKAQGREYQAEEITEEAWNKINLDSFVLKH